MTDESKNKTLGASKEAISAHYDLGNDFYSLWLDPTMTYSAALWEATDDLQQAQLKKIDMHLHNLNLFDNARLLDVGCGWGSLLQRAREKWPNLKATGLTLSLEQYKYIQLELTHVKALYESWENHQPIHAYDGIVSIGAFEHFVKPGLSDSKKIKAYRKFFQKCHALSKKNTYLSLQTIVYENFNEILPNDFVKTIFPESDLPRLYQILEAADDFYEIIYIRNDGCHYAKTLRAWFKNFTLNKDQIRLQYGNLTYEKYVTYLGSFAIGFEQGTVNLARIKMKRKT